MKLKKRKGYGVEWLTYCVAGFGMALMVIIFSMFVALFIKQFASGQFQNVTLYDNSGQIVGQWTGDFSVTRNGDTTKIKNSERVIEITGGIVIAEGN